MNWQEAMKRKQLRLIKYFNPSILQRGKSDELDADPQYPLSGSILL
jgi:hypothetical protein